MKPIKLSLCLSVATLSFVAGNLPAQTPPSLAIQLFAGLNITGTTGSVYTVQFVNDLAQSNAWTSLAFVQLPETNHLFVDTSVPANTRRFYRAVLQTPGTNLVFIPPNAFNLGSPSNEVQRSLDEGPQTVVTITHAFWMGKFEVTQGEYLSVVGSNPSFATGNPNLPVESVSWSDATNYCALRTQQELAAGRIPAGTHYRLPTEAEWEYAARAGSSTRYSYGEDLSLVDLTNHAWLGASGGLVTHPVGQKLPNAWGLYDTIGNVLEWTLDWYAPYPGGFAVDPQGPPVSFDFLSTFKVTRGGAFDSPESSSRSASRGIFAPPLHDSDLGFRVVLAVGSP